MILVACSIFLNMYAAITWENTGDLQNALYVYDITVGMNGYIFAGTKIDNGGSLDCGRVFYSQDMWNWQPCDSVPWISPDDEIEGVFALYNGVGDTLFAGTGLYHSGDVPRVHKSSDGGATWVPLNSYGTYRVGSRVTAFLEDNAGNLHLGNNYMGMSAAIPRYSTDRGSGWSMPTGILYNGGQYCLFQASDNTIYFGAWSDYIHHSTDNGVTWSGIAPPVNISDTYSVIETGSGAIFAGTNADIGRLFVSTDQGDTWTEKGDGYFGTTTAIRSLCYASDGAIYAGTSPNAEVFVSVDNGDTWISTGVLTGATTVYKIIEATKEGGAYDSTFLFAATGPNGDVFRGLLYTIGVKEEKGLREDNLSPRIFCQSPVRGNNALLSVTLNDQQPVCMNVLNTIGAVVYEDSRMLASGNNRLEINLKGIPQGVYFLRLLIDGETYTRKLVVLK